MNELVRDDAQSTTPSRAGRYLGFNLGKQLFAVEILKVREIVCGLSVTPIPRAEKSIRGVINLRGKIIPVVDLRTTLGMSETELDERTCFIVVDVVRASTPAQMGVLVDAVSDVFSLKPEDIESAPSLEMELSASTILGISQLKGVVRILLDIQALLGSV